MANETTIQTAAAVNKAAIARQIYAEVGATLPRKDVLARFQKEAHLTTAGAATYYQLIKKNTELAQAGSAPATAKK